MAARKFKNSDVHTRVWPTIQVDDGSTLELAPGEVVVLDLPAKFSDAHLVPVGSKKKKEPEETTGDETTGEDEGVISGDEDKVKE